MVTQLEKMVYDRAQFLLSEFGNQALVVNQWLVQPEGDAVIFSSRQTDFSLTIGNPKRDEFLNYPDGDDPGKNQWLSTIMVALNFSRPEVLGSFESEQSQPEKKLSTTELAVTIAEAIKKFGAKYGFATDDQSASRTAVLVSRRLLLILEKNRRANWLERLPTQDGVVVYLTTRFWQVIEMRQTAGLFYQSLSGHYKSAVHISNNMLELLADMSQDQGLATAKKAKEVTYE